jgi:hypothetical protein
MTHAVQRMGPRSHKTQPTRASSGRAHTQEKWESQSKYADTTTPQNASPTQPANPLIYEATAQSTHMCPRARKPQNSTGQTGPLCRPQAEGAAGRQAPLAYSSCSCTLLHGGHAHTCECAGSCNAGTAIRPIGAHVGGTCSGLGACATALLEPPTTARLVTHPHTCATH